MSNEINTKKSEENIDKTYETSDDDMEYKEINAKFEQNNLDSTVFNFYQIEAIKSLILLAPVPSSRSTKKILSTVYSSSISSIYNRILESIKISNKELVHYLSLINLYPHPHLNLDSLVSFKLSSQDKYLGPAVFLYFSIADKYYDSMSFNQRLSLFYRYIYVFSSHMFSDHSIFELFCKVLEKDFLDFFVEKKLYQNFSFFKEFLSRFGDKLGDLLIKIGYEYPESRNFIFATHRSLSNTIGVSASDWLVQRWACNVPYSIPHLFYYYGCTPFLKNLALSKFESVIDPIVEIKSNLGQFCQACCICKGKNDVSYKVDTWIQAKQSIEKAIESFNATSNLSSPLDISFIRLIPSVDIKVLGQLLCKEKNVALLYKFTKSFDFKSMNLLDALRLYTSSFVMAGESQVIDRILRAFSNVYAEQNIFIPFYQKHKIENKENFINDAVTVRSIQDEKNLETSTNTQDLTNELFLNQEHYITKIKKVSYGFIAINTMLFNPSIEKKPSFEDYVKLLDYSEEYYTDSEYDIVSFDLDDFKLFFESIKSNEMKIPHTWTDGYDKFVLFKKCLNEFDGIFPLKANIDNNASTQNNVSEKHESSTCDNLSQTTISSSAFQNLKSTTLPRQHLNNHHILDQTKVNQMTQDSKDLSICNSCVITCYKNLFYQLSNSFMFLSPSSYFEICQMLNFEDQFCKYVEYAKADVIKSLESCKIYLENYKLNETVAEILLDTLEKTEKPKSSVLPDLKSMFAKNTMNNAKAIPTSSIYLSIVDEIVNVKFQSRSICNYNVNLLNSLSSDRKSYVRQIICKLVLNNANSLDDISNLDEQLQYTILLTSPQEKLEFASDSIKMKFILNELRSGNIYDSYHEIFKQINIINDESFEAFLIFQQKYDDFNQFFDINISEQKNDSTQQIALNEAFKDQLKTTEDVLRLCSSSNTILNIKYAKKIHKNGCPLNDPTFQDFKKVLYVILKSGNDKSLIEYTSCLINFLSDSLILLIKLYDFIFPVFEQITPELRGFLIKIFLKRVKIYLDNGIACCNETINNSVNSQIKNLASRFCELNYISQSELKQYQLLVKQKFEVIEL